MLQSAVQHKQAATRDAGFKMSHMPNPHKVNLERKALIDEVRIPSCLQAGAHLMFECAPAYWEVAG